MAREATRPAEQEHDAESTKEGADKVPPRPQVAHRPPAPVAGDPGARAAGSAEDDITDSPGGSATT